MIGAPPLTITLHAGEHAVARAVLRLDERDVVGVHRRGRGSVSSAPAGIAPPTRHEVRRSSSNAWVARSSGRAVPPSAEASTVPPCLLHDRAGVVGRAGEQVEAVVVAVGSGSVCPARSVAPCRRGGS